MTQGIAIALILCIAAAIYADYHWFSWEYTLWAAQHFVSFADGLKFWR